MKAELSAASIKLSRSWTLGHTMDSILLLSDAEVPEPSGQL